MIHYSNSQMIVHLLMFILSLLKMEGNSWRCSGSKFAWNVLESGFIPKYHKSKKVFMEKKAHVAAARANIKSGNLF